MTTLSEKDIFCCTKHALLFLNFDLSIVKYNRDASFRHTDIKYVLYTDSELCLGNIMHELIVGCIGSYNNECFSQDTVTCIAYSCPSTQLIDLTSCETMHYSELWLHWVPYL